MPWWRWSLIGVEVLAVAYSGIVLALVLFGRRNDARALATFIPDCILLVKRLARDPRVPRARKPLLFGVVGYLALPFDLIPTSSLR